MEKYVHIRIPELLQEKGISKNKLCQDLNLQRTNLNKYCNNKHQRIDAALIIKLCDYFNCGISDLLEIREVPDSKKEIPQKPMGFKPIFRNSKD